MSTLPSSQLKTAVASGLEPYSGPWTRTQAAHLLRRALFGPKKQEITDATSMGLSATLDQLLNNISIPSPPVNPYSDEDPNVAIGEVWVEQPYYDQLTAYRGPAFRGWYWQNLINHDFNIMARMTMFWINHFGMSDLGDTRVEYQAINLFNTGGTGSFRTMVEKVTVLPGMLKFLNGDNNTKWNPNENFARELLELFTIQKGDQIGLEDYTNYTEDDVRAAARILTGWRNQGYWSNTEAVVSSYFDPDLHTTGTKTMSFRFDNAVIGSDDPNYNAEEEYKELLDVIFGKAETARAICRELYRFFVFSDINAQVETDVIVPLAQVMINNDFEMVPTLRALLGSQHFYDIAVRGPLIKSPYDFTVSAIRTMGGYAHLGLDLSNNTTSNPLLASAYFLGTGLHWKTEALDMDFLFPPTVAGWKAYYQTPGFYRNWIGSSTLKSRKSLVDEMTNRGIWTRVEATDNYEPRPFDYFGFVAALNDPFDPIELIAECAEIFLPRELHPDQLDALKEELIPGLPDQEWTRQYADYLQSPFNPDVANPVQDRLKSFFRALFSMAEFHLM